MPVATRHRLDALGTLCPLPILLTVRALTELEIGEVLEIVGDDAAIPGDMRAYCETSGNRLLEIEEEGDVVRCWVEKRSEL